MQHEGLADLVTMLSYCRPAGSAFETSFIDRFIAPTGALPDGAGNYHLVVGGAPSVLWSSHTDTVHGEGGRQLLAVTGSTIMLADDTTSRCLGADCTVGVWLMLQMIAANVPGWYVFHRAEEVGGIGSRWIADNMSEALLQIQAAIAFDRMGTGSVITHQFGGRCCSDRFAEDLAQRIGLNMVTDPSGSFTDTANYTHLVPECTNISVGYYSQHTPRETLNIDHVVALRDALVTIDMTDITIARDPTVDDFDDWGRAPRRCLGGWADDDIATGDLDRMVSMICDHPHEVAVFLQQLGYSSFDLADEIREV